MPEGNECVLPPGATWEDKMDICRQERRIVSRRDDACVVSCGENEVARYGHCECDLWVYDSEGDGRRCVDKCASFFDGNVCVDVCPVERAFHESSGKCVAACAGGVDSEGLCLEAGSPSNGRKNRSGLVAAVVVPVVLVIVIATVVTVLVCKRRS